MISNEHFSDLKKSGLTDTTIKEAKIYSVCPGDIKGKLGFDLPQIESLLAFPYGSGFERFKVFPSFKDKDGHTIKYLQPKGTPARLYIPPQAHKGLGDTNTPLAIVEGEKKTLRLIQEGYPAIGVGGVWSWSQNGHTTPDFEKIVLQGRIVNFFPDSDVWGRPDLLKAVYAFCRELESRGANVVVVKLPQNGSEKIGVDDYLQSGRTIANLQELPTTTTKGFEFVGLESWFVARGMRKVEENTPLSTYPPVLKNEALYGLAGDVVKAIEPETEASLVALLTNFLTAFGNIIGDKPYFMADGSRHSMRLFIVHVGETSKGRKGTAWAHIKRLFECAEPEWSSERTTSGLSSGEGLIWAVRDPIEKTEPIREKQKIVNYQTVVIDQGISDKRLLVSESEFSSVLKVISREGNTLSAIIRCAWDCGNLRTLTKNTPAKATNAHISILAHITKEELLRYLDSTEAGNGFGNRFLWLCVRRSKCLSEGGKEVNIEPLVSRLKRCIDFAQTVCEMKRDDNSRDIWHEVYPTLSEGKAGLFGALTSRAEAQVMRLSCIYALLDCSPMIRTEHLLASLALWEYVEASVRYIFGNTTGDPTADKILKALEQAENGLSREDIYKGVLSAHVKSERINNAIKLLISYGLVSVGSVESTGGRPREVLLVKSCVESVESVESRMGTGT